MNSWLVQPTVYLAIFAALANSALRLARAQAIPISWWYHASRGGTIRSLERQWDVSHSLVRAVLYSRHMSILNIACIAASFVIIDGPLLQRASSVVPAMVTSEVNLQLVLPPELPRGFSGTYYHFQVWETKDYWHTSEDWTKDSPISFNAPACNGSVSHMRVIDVYLIPC